MRRKKREARSTGVFLEEPVIRYLDELSETEDRNRSYFINQAVREYAERRGVAIPSAKAKESRNGS